MTRFKYGICLWVVPFVNPFDACRCISEAGFDGIQLQYHDEMLDNADIDAAYANIKKAADTYNLEIMSIAVTALDNISMVAPDGSETAQKAVRCLNDTLKIAKRFGIKRIMVPNFVNSDLRGTDKEADECKLKIAADRLRQLCDNAAPFGIEIASESLLKTEGISELIRLVDRDNISYYYDSQNHYLHMGVKMDELFNENCRLIHELHVKDGVENELSAALLGEGTSGFYDTAKAISESSFSGYIVTENYYHLPPLSEKAPIEQLLSSDLFTMRKAFINK